MVVAPGLGAEASADPGQAKKSHSLHSFGAVFVEVNIDRELGVIRVPRVVARYSIGRLLNATTGRSQLMGGIVWGIGMALMEQSLLDARDGRIVNADLAEYHVPTNADIGDIDVDVVEEYDSVISPLGARGIGEIGITGVAAASTAASGGDSQSNWFKLVADAVHEIVVSEQALARMQGHLLLRFPTLDQEAMLTATRRGEADIVEMQKTTADCGAKCPVDPTQPLQLMERLKSCADPTWLPRGRQLPR